jgi:hypothetical protein
VSYKLKNGGDFIFGELAHGSAGAVQDYEELFRVQGKLAVLKMLNLFASKKKVANKSVCPCGCGRILKKCKTHSVIVPFRKMLLRTRYKAIWRDLAATAKLLT